MNRRSCELGCLKMSSLVSLEPSLSSPLSPPAIGLKKKRIVLAASDSHGGEQDRCQPSCSAGPPQRPGIIKKKKFLFSPGSGESYERRCGAALRGQLIRYIQIHKKYKNNRGGPYIITNESVPISARPGDPTNVTVSLYVDL